MKSVKLYKFKDEQELEQKMQEILNCSYAQILKTEFACDGKNLYLLVVYYGELK